MGGLVGSEQMVVRFNQKLMISTNRSYRIEDFKKKMAPCIFLDNAKKVSKKMNEVKGLCQGYLKKMQFI